MAAFGSGFDLARDTLPEVRTHLELWPEQLPESGSLAETSVALLLARARMLRATGVLGLRGERFVYLLRGQPVFVDSVLQVDGSDVYLVNAGLLRERALAETRERATQQGSGVGEAMLQMGVISATELFEHKREHTRQRLVDSLGWREGTARFEERELFGSEIVPIPVDLAQVLSEGVVLHYDDFRLARELPVGEAHRVYLTGPSDDARGLALGSLEAQALSRAAARPSLATLAMDLRVEPSPLHRALFVLYHLGLVGFDLSSEDAPPRPPARAAPPPAEVIRPGRMTAPRPGGPPRRIASPAPMPAARPPRPTPAAPAVGTPRRVPSPAAPMPAARPPRPTPGPVLGASDGPASPRRQLAPLGQPTRSAAGYLEDAELARDAGNIEDALLALRYAHVVEPKNPSIKAELALMFLQVDEKAFAREAGRLARDARRDNPSLPLPYVVLGMLMEQLRDYSRAAQLYKYALSHDPGCEEARRRVQLLAERRRR